LTLLEGGEVATVAQKLDYHIDLFFGLDEVLGEVDLDVQHLDHLQPILILQLVHVDLLLELVDDLLAFHHLAIFDTDLAVLIEELEVLHIAEKQTSKISEFGPDLLLLRDAQKAV
jgi:hypothetical protein